MIIFITYPEAYPGTHSFPFCWRVSSRFQRKPLGCISLLFSSANDTTNLGFISQKKSGTDTRLHWMNLQKPCDMSLTGMKVTGAPRWGPGDTPPAAQPQHQRERSDLKSRSFQEQYWLPWGSWSFHMSLSVSVSMCVCTCLCVWMTVWLCVCVCVCVCVCTAHVCMQRVLFSLLKRMGLLWSRMGLGGGACDGG